MQPNAHLTRPIFCRLKFAVKVASRLQLSLLECYPDRGGTPFLAFVIAELTSATTGIEPASQKLRPANSTCLASLRNDLARRTSREFLTHAGTSYYLAKMFCPQCGSTQSDDLKFCKSCGANLEALRQVMATRETAGKFDWSKTWVAEMFTSGEDAVRHQAEIERLQGKTPEVKRLLEIKGGIITASVGIGLMILLFVLMNGIVASGRVSDAAAEILMRLWIVGVLPLLIGAALVFNGMFVSKRGVGLAAHETDTGTKDLDAPKPGYLPPADTNDLVSPAPFSVTDRTTRHLQKEPRK